MRNRTGANGIRLHYPSRKVNRIVRTATHAYEDRFCESIRDRLTPVTRSRLEAPLQPVDGEINAEETVERKRQSIAHRRVTTLPCLDQLNLFA